MGNLTREYQGDELLVVAEAGVYWKGLTECCPWMGIAVKPGLEPALGLCGISS